MRVFIKISLLLFFFSIKTNLAAQPSDWQKKVAPSVLKSAATGKTVHFLAVFAEQADLSGAKNLRSKTEKGQFVFEKLRSVADRSQARARVFLHEKRAFANSFFVANLMAVKGDISLIKSLAEFPEIARIEPDLEMKLQFFDEKNTVSERGGPEWGLQKIGADSVWAMGITGQGVTVAGEDTGYDWQHPALRDHYRGWNGAIADHNYNWHDAIHEISPLAWDTLNPCGLNLQAPCDDNNHGTHTMGTMIGDDGAGNQIGVAPGARWMACRNMERGNGRPSTYIECFQFFLAPTDLAGEKPEPTRAPHVINNSWYCSESEGCDSTFDAKIMQTVIENLQLAGIVVVISNGNAGPNCETTTLPALFEPSFSVGATRQDDTIAGFSSRGAAFFDGKKMIKPNVSAPGVNVRSSIRNGEYAFFGGTSMAGPHVAGAVALIISANPDLAGQVEVIENIIEQTAVRKFSEQDCSGVDSGVFPNNIYGWGRIDVFAAVKMARAMSPFEPMAELFPNPFSGELTVKMTNLTGDFSFRLFDATGRFVFEKKYVVDRSLTKTFSTGDLDSGVYFYEIKCGSERFSGKLVKI